MTRHLLAFAAFYALVMAFSGLTLRHAEASTTYLGATVRRGDVETLTAMVIAESGWTSRDAAAAEVAVIARRAARRDMSLGTMARLYSSALRRPNRPWVLDLHDRRRPPAAWPAASWPRHRLLYRAMRRHVASVLSGESPDPCADSEPVHFGNAQDGARMHASRWKRVCEDVHQSQMFWRSN